MGKTVRKRDLVGRIAGRLGLSSGLVDRVVTVTLEEIGAALGREEEVSLAGFGTFDARTLRARIGVHPRTGVDMQYPECRVPSFRAGVRLKRRVRNVEGNGV